MSLCEFLITADAPMNSFQIPQLAGQIYAMAGMQTKLHVLANKVGDFQRVVDKFQWRRVLEYGIDRQGEHAKRI